MFLMFFFSRKLKEVIAYGKRDSFETFHYALQKMHFDIIWIFSVKKRETHKLNSIFFCACISSKIFLINLVRDEMWLRFLRVFHFLPSLFSFRKMFSFSSIFNWIWTNFHQRRRTKKAKRNNVSRII